MTVVWDLKPENQSIQPLTGTGLKTRHLQGATTTVSPSVNQYPTDSYPFNSAGPVRHDFINSDVLTAGGKAFRIIIPKSGGVTSRYMFSVNVPGIKVPSSGPAIPIYWGILFRLRSDLIMSEMIGGGKGFMSSAGPTTRYTSTSANGPYGDFGAIGESGAALRHWDSKVNSDGTVGAFIAASYMDIGPVLPLDEWSLVIVSTGWSVTSNGWREVWRTAGAKSYHLRYDGKTSFTAATFEHRLGPYRGSNFTTNSTLEIAFMRRATTLAEVDPGYDPGGAVVTPTPTPTTTVPSVPTNVTALNAATVGSVVISADAPVAADAFDYFAIRYFVGASPPAQDDPAWLRLNVGGETRAGVGGYFKTNNPITTHVTGLAAGQVINYYVTKVNTAGLAGGRSLVVPVTIGGAVTPALRSITAVNDALTLASSSEYTILAGDAVFKSGTLQSPVDQWNRSGAMTPAVFDVTLGSLVWAGINWPKRVSSTVASGWSHRSLIAFDADTRVILRRRYECDVPTTAVTGTASTDTFAKTAHGFSAGDALQLDATTGGTGLSTGTVYYVIATGLTSSAFKVAATVGGTAVDFTTDVTAATFTRITLDAYDLVLRENGVDPGVTVPYVKATDVGDISSLKIAFPDPDSVSFQGSADDPSGTLTFMEFGQRDFSDAALTTAPAAYGEYTQRDFGDVKLSTPSTDRVFGSTILQADSTGASNGAITGTALNFAGTGQIEWALPRTAPPLTVVAMLKRVSDSRNQYVWSNSKDGTNFGRGGQLIPVADATWPNHSRYHDAVGGASSGIGAAGAPDYGRWQLHQWSIDTDKYVTIRWWDATTGTFSDFERIAAHPNGGVITSSLARLIFGSSTPTTVSSTALRGPGVWLSMYDHVLTAAEFRSIVSPTGIGLRARAMALTGKSFAIEPRAVAASYTDLVASLVSTAVVGTVTAYAALTGVTGVNSTDVFTKTAHGLVAGAPVSLSGLTGGSGLSTTATYYVIAPTANTFQLSLTRGGTAVDLGSDVTAATVNDVPWDVGTSTVAISQQQAPPQPSTAPTIDSIDTTGTLGSLRLTAVAVPAGFTPNATPIGFFRSLDGALWQQIGSWQSATTLTVADVTYDIEYQYSYAYRNNATPPRQGDFSVPTVSVLSSSASAGLVPLTAPVLTRVPRRLAGGTAEFRVAVPLATQSVDSYHVYLTPRNSAGAATGAEFLAYDGPGTTSGAEVILSVTGLSDAVPRYAYRLAAWRTEA